MSKFKRFLDNRLTYAGEVNLTRHPAALYPQQGPLYLFLVQTESTSGPHKKLRGLSPQANYTDRGPSFVSEVSANLFEDRVCCVVSVTNPYGRILGFLDRSLYYFFQVAPHLYSRGWVDPVPDLFFFLRLELFSQLKTPRTLSAIEPVTSVSTNYATACLDVHVV
jgi:hypothetical protein